ncbi:MAG: hypothetical protein J6S89_08270 [Paludibacteraceae bacterium]|nr:hypothetical protein [Paludibacteraceae bacterium]MBP5664514.1 hypothetical protein [Bacteroidales bacterium]
MSNKYTFSIIVIFLVIIWGPLQAYIETDGAFRIPMALSFIAVLMWSSDIIKFCFRKAVAFYLILALYIFINGLAHHSQLLYGEGFMGVYLMAVALFLPVMIMLVVFCCSRYKLDKTLQWITVALVVYCVLCFSSGEMVDDISGEGQRFTSIINANEVALMLAICFAFLYLLFVRGRIRLPFFVSLGILIVIGEMATGSRMGFSMVGIMSVSSIIMLRKRGKINSFLKTVSLLLIAFVLIYYMMEYTYVGQRLSSTTTQTETMVMATGTIWDKFGDRGLQYYYSWPFFLKSPIFGIGFHQWVNVGNFGYVCHSEYLVQYLEDGLIGIGLYLPFFFGLIMKLWRNRNKANSKESATNKVVLSAMFAIAFANAVLWTFSSIGVFALYGIAHVLTIDDSRKKVKSLLA